MRWEIKTVSKDEHDLTLTEAVTEAYSNQAGDPWEHLFEALAAELPTRDELINLNLIEADWTDEDVKDALLEHLTNEDEGALVSVLKEAVDLDDPRTDDFKRTVDDISLDGLDVDALRERLGDRLFAKFKELNP